MRIGVLVLVLQTVLWGLAGQSPRLSAADFQAGAALVDVTPPQLPVLVNGGMTSRTVDKIKTPVAARSLVFSDGQTQLAIVVVDSCMMGRVLLDDIKALAEGRTGIPRDRILISATHAHSAPASMGCLGTSADPDYVPWFRDRLVESVAAAQANLQPARIGFARAAAPEFTALRQWIRRPDRIELDPFGNRTVRANMHAGANLDDVTGEAGPEDPELSLISVQSRDGQPLAVLANFSMHYFGDQDISADYFGLFSDGLRDRLAPGSGFVGIMSHGCSGDIWRRDYMRPETWDPGLTIDAYAAGLVDIAVAALQSVSYRDDVPISMAEERMTLAYRVPDQQRLEWAQRVMAEVGVRLPNDTREVYAREQILLHEAQQTEIVVQALRLGDIAIATTPNETYAVTGLKIKAASPLPDTMVIELANGGDGYIPPPEQHAFGGYNTWAARSAGLEVSAEPRIAQSAIRLLESVTGQPRRDWALPEGSGSSAILGLKPAAWWRLNEFSGPLAADSSEHHRAAALEPAITYYLEGPHSEALCGSGQLNRCPQFVGGRLSAVLPDLTESYSISLWIWNGMPLEAREVAGWMYSRDFDHGLSSSGEHLGIGGQGDNSGKLIFRTGSTETPLAVGRSVIPRWEWHHVAIVRSGERIEVFLDGQSELECRAARVNCPQVFVGGRSDNQSNWEGRIDEVAVFTRALSDTELQQLAHP